MVTVHNVLARYWLSGLFLYFTINVQKGTGNYKQRKDAGNRRLCPYRNFSQAIILST